MFKHLLPLKEIQYSFLQLSKVTNPKKYCKFLNPDISIILNGPLYLITEVSVGAAIALNAFYRHYYMSGTWRSPYALCLINL